MNLNSEFHRYCYRVLNNKKQAEEQEIQIWKLSLIVILMGLFYWIFDILFCIILRAI